MKLQLSKEFKVGFTVILIAVAMYWLVFFLKGRDIFSRFNTYYAVYENVEGLTGPVYIQGLKIGTINQIVYNQKQHRLELSLSLESKYKIPANSVAQIYSADLLGTKAIRIVMGDSPQFLADKDTLATDISLDIINYLSRELPALREQIGALLTGFETAMEQVNTVLGSDNRALLQNSLADLSATLDHFKSFSAYLNTETPQIRDILNNIKQLTDELGGSSSDIGASLANLRAFTDTLRQADVAGLVQNLDRLIVGLQNPEGSIGQLMDNDELYKKITRLLENVDSLVCQISQNPKKYLKFSVF
ncbi:MAG: MlaD family protein [Bacteroidales bacterium]|nr:MlaD family protein [Bacteroidales bacterium]MCL2739057.1 MlaD family protein [Bacteroidales bacterium]